MSDALERARLYLEADEWRKANAVPLCYCGDSILTYPCFLIKDLVTKCERLRAEVEQLRANNVRCDGCDDTQFIVEQPVFRMDAHATD